MINRTTKNEPQARRHVVLGRPKQIRHKTQQQSWAEKLVDFSWYKTSLLQPTRWYIWFILHTAQSDVIVLRKPIQWMIFRPDRARQDKEVRSIQHELGREIWAKSVLILQTPKRTGKIPLGAYYAHFEIHFLPMELYILDKFINR